MAFSARLEQNLRLSLSWHLPSAAARKVMMSVSHFKFKFSHKSALLGMPGEGSYNVQFYQNLLVKSGSQGSKAVAWKRGGTSIIRKEGYGWPLPSQSTRASWTALSRAFSILIGWGPYADSTLSGCSAAALINRPWWTMPMCKVCSQIEKRKKHCLQWGVGNCDKVTIHALGGHGQFWTIRSS